MWSSLLGLKQLQCGISIRTFPLHGSKFDFSFEAAAFGLSSSKHQSMFQKCVMPLLFAKTASLANPVFSIYYLFQPCFPYDLHMDQALYYISFQIDLFSQFKALNQMT